MSFTVAVAALLRCLARERRGGDAPAARPTAAGAPPAPPSPTGTPAAEAPSAGTLSLVSAKTTPRKSFFYGVRNPSLRFEIESTQPQNDLRIDVVDDGRRSRAQLLPQRRRTATPSRHPLGRHDAAKAGPRRNGHYSFRIGPQGGTASRRPGLDLEPNRSASASTSTATPSRSSARTTSATPAAASAPAAPATPTRART